MNMARSISAPASRYSIRRPIPSSRSPRMRRISVSTGYMNSARIHSRACRSAQYWPRHRKAFYRETQANLHPHRQSPRLFGAAAGADIAGPADTRRAAWSSPSARSAISMLIRALSQVRKANGNMALFDETLVAMDDAQDGDLVFTNFVDFDMLYGHRRDVPGLCGSAGSLRPAAARSAWPNCGRAILWFSLQITAATRPIRELTIRANGCRFSATVRTCPTAHSAFARPSPTLEKPSPRISVSQPGPHGKSFLKGTGDRTPDA